MNESLSSFFEQTFFLRIKEKSEKIKNSNYSMNKKSFKKVIKLLEKANESSEMIMDAGIDVSMHDMLFYDVIEELLSLFFNDKQLELIQLYLFEKISNEKIKETNIPNNIDELWNNVKQIEN